MVLEQTVALVTGGASGLGEAAARALRARGADIVVIDLSEAEERVRDAGFAFAPADVRDPTAVEGAVAFARARGPLRTVVNCAGIAIAGRILTRRTPHDLDAFARVQGINVVGTFNVLRMAAAAMAEQPLAGETRGVIINTASVAAFEGQIGQVAYSASKAAIAGMTLPAARDLADSGIRCMAVAPGTFRTRLLEDLPAAALEKVTASVPLPSRLGEPDEFGALVVHIAENDMLNGEVIRIDGAVRLAAR